MPAKRVPSKGLRLRDGRTIQSVRMAKDGGTFVVYEPKTRKRRTVRFRYQAAGSNIFVVGAGPGGCIYFGSARHLWRYRW